MGLNKAKGRMFQSVGWTWNPIAGCSHNCKYCWAESLSKRWGKTFEPQFREKYLKDKMPNDGSWIFVGSMGDTFCDAVPNAWIQKLFNFIENCEADNKFLLMTKNPMRFCEWTGTLERIRDKVILGTTIETNRNTKEFSDAAHPLDRMIALRFMKQSFNHTTFLSMEPISNFDLDKIKLWIQDIQPKAIEIGLENYTEYTDKPLNIAICELVTWIRETNISLVLKDNLRWLEE